MFSQSRKASSSRMFSSSVVFATPCQAGLCGNPKNFPSSDQPTSSRQHLSCAKNTSLASFWLLRVPSWAHCWALASTKTAYVTARPCLGMKPGVLTSVELSISWFRGIPGSEEKWGVLASFSSAILDPLGICTKSSLRVIGESNAEECLPGFEDGFCLVCAEERGWFPADLKYFFNQ